MSRLFATAFVLLASSALAQQNSWTIDRVSGTAVMEEVSPLVFRVANAATSGRPIDSFTIGIPATPYDIDGATAPVGWRATTIDRRNRRITFAATTRCTATSGLRPGQSALFEVRVLPVAAARDGTGDIDRTRTDVVDVCGTNPNFRNVTGSSGWTLVGFAGRVTTNVRTMELNDQLTVTLTITNDTTGTQNTITPTTPVISGTATFTLVSGPTPASVTNLAQDGIATFSWTYRATARGTARFSATARNSTTSSPAVTSPDVLVGTFPAAVVASPTSVVSGGTATLRVLPSNNDLTTITHVTPTTMTATPTGTAGATRLTGPTPATVGALAPRSTTSFTTTWSVTGLPGETVTFSGGATAVDAGGTSISSAPTTSATVRVDEVSVTASPQSVLSGAGATQFRYTVANGSTQNITSVVLIRPDTNLFRTQAAVGAPTGWTSATSSNPRGIRFSTTTAPIAPGGSQVFTISFASIGTVTDNTPVSHKAQVTYADTTTGRTNDTVTVVLNRAVPDVLLPVATATPTRAYFTWSNPAIHDGVLLLRSTGAPPNTAPIAGVRYPVGSTLGNATVVYEDSASFNTSFADTGLTNGTSYYYRLYNRDEYGLYSPGNVPAAAPGNYLLVIAPGTAPSDALWCTTVGLPALQQPYTDLGRAVYQSSNGAFFTGSAITVGAPVNGNEKWRPTQTRAVVQARPMAIRLSGATDPSLFVGDQAGYAYRLSSVTGAITWTGNGASPLGEVIQAQASVAVRAYTNAAFQGKYAQDLVLFSTRNSTNRSSNSVTALDATTGASVFRYQPGDLDQVTGPLLLDLQNNTLWIASARTAGPSLRVIDLLNPANPPLLTVTDLGDIPSGVSFNGQDNVAIVVDRNGVARGYDVTTRVQRWQFNVGATVTAPLVTYLGDFFASTATGVQLYHVDPTTWAVTPVWPSPAAMTQPTSVRVWATNGKVFVGDGAGYLRRLDLATGAQEAAVRVSTSGAVSMPSLDTTAGLQRVYLGTADGRLCAYSATF